jgi:membrane protein required for colicin V production
MQSLARIVDQVGWIDLTAIGILALCGVLGLVRGFTVQVVRLLGVFLGYFAASRWAEPLALRLHQWFGGSIEQPAHDPFGVYLAYFLLFFTVLVALSLLAYLLRDLLKRTGLTLADRLSGGALGVVTGAALVLMGLTLVLAFFPETSVTAEAKASRAGHLAARTVRLVAGASPPAIRDLFAAWQETRPAPGGPVDASGRRESAPHTRGASASRRF